MSQKSLILGPTLTPKRSSKLFLNQFTSKVPKNVIIFELILALNHKSTESTTRRPQHKSLNAFISEYYKRKMDLISKRPTSTIEPRIRVNFNRTLTKSLVPQLSKTRQQCPNLGDPVKLLYLRPKIDRSSTATSSMLWAIN
jgi:hypothetical protein